MNIETIFNLKNLSSTVVIISVIVFSLIIYLTYTYLNKNSSEDKINYNYLIYSIILSFLVTVLVVYIYNNCKFTNYDRLTEDFYS